MLLLLVERIVDVITLREVEDMQIRLTLGGCLEYDLTLQRLARVFACPPDRPSRNKECAHPKNQFISWTQDKRRVADYDM